jgi:hypothetical protein
MLDVQRVGNVSTLRAPFGGDRRVPSKLWIEEVPAIPLYQQIDLYGANKRVAWKARSDELIRAYDRGRKDGK